MVRVSVIIPVYNDSININECILSIVEKQSEKSIEVICVDDGSTDETYKVLCEYSRKYDCVHVIKQEHQGLSVARNTGLKMATGEFVYFVDSDDIVAENMIEKASNLCKNENLDVLFFSFKSFGDNEAISQRYEKHILGNKRVHEYNKKVVTGKELHEIFWTYKEYYPMVWIQFVRRDFLQANHIIFKEGLIYEDNLYTFFVLINAKRTRCVNEIWYYKRIRDNSITTGKESIISVYSFLYSYLTIIQYFINIIDRKQLFTATEKIGMIQKSYKDMLCDLHQTLERRYLRLSTEEKKELFSRCDETEREVLATLDISISVIIPLYNMEQYIEECIQSVQRQTLQNIEIIVVDDGSTDNSPAIVQSMAKEDKRICYLRENNNGSGAARNKGLENATGDYIAFLDADDFYFESDALKRMIWACECHGQSICGSYRVEYKNEKIHKTDFLMQFENLSNEGMVVNFSEYQFDFFYQSYIYRRDFIIKNNLRFPNYRRYQDPPFLLKAMDQAKSFCVVPTILHCYRKGHQNYANNGKHINSILQGIRDNLLLSEGKYEKVFDESIQRLDTMFFEDIKRFWTKEVRELVCEINNIYRRHKPGQGNMTIINKLTDEMGDIDGSLLS